MSDNRPTVALYHHLPPGGADRAMYELTKRTADDFRYVLYEVKLGTDDRVHGAVRAPIHQVVDEVRRFNARAGGGTAVGRWGVTIPGMLRAERRIARDILSDASLDAMMVHHQRFLQAPTLLTQVPLPRGYFVQEPRRRSFEYDLRNGTNGPGRLLASLTRPLDAAARRLDITNTRAADTLFCNSDHSREYIWRAYGRDATVVRLGVDETTFCLAAGAARRNEILAVGSLDPSKGHDLAVDALGLLPAASRPALRIVYNRADTATAGDLVKRAETLGVRLTLEPNASEAELVSHYQQARAVVLTARVEPLGLTALEAMACGTPVVAVREGGYRETVTDGVTGLLTDRTAPALSDGLAQVMSGTFAPTPRALRCAVLHRFHWDQAVDVYRRELLRLAASRP